MTQTNCICRISCRVAAIVAALVIGILTAFLQITGVFMATVPFLIVAFGVAAVYLLGVLLAVAMTGQTEYRFCRCSALRIVLIGILAALVLAVVLLVFGITATSIVSAVLVGLLAAALTLIFAGTVCLVRCLADCEG